MSLKCVAPFGADYPTLGLFAVEPGQLVELAGVDRERALATTMFEDVPKPRPRPTPRKRTRSKTSTPVAAATENTEGSE